MGMKASKGDYNLYIYYDDDPPNPRIDCDNVTRMICFHPRHSLGDKHNYPGKDEFLRELFSECFPSEEKAERAYDRIYNTHAPKGSYTWSAAADRAMDSDLLAVIAQKHIILPLFIYDHSGIAMNTTGFHCPWDSGQVGWIYTKKDDVAQAFLEERYSGALQEKAEALLIGDVEYYNSFLQGECYGFILEKCGEEVDSCWGFMGDIKSVLPDIEEYLPPECQGIIANMNSDSPYYPHHAHTPMSAEYAMDM